jgi:AsmA protein
MTIDGSDLAWPTARLNLSGDRLEGALSSRQEGERRMITGTLAADRLDLTSLVMPLLQAGSPESNWVSDGSGPDGKSGTDLDLRFSASTARVGLLRTQDLAANISFKPGRYEASVGRVSINKGIVKGRATLASAADGIEIKGQSSFERLDLGSFLSDLGSSRWISGLAQGQFTLEGSGKDAAEIIRHLHGRASVTVRQGELVDVKLTDALRRSDGKALTAFPAARSGRMPFDEAHLHATVTNGVAEIADGGLSAAGLRAALHGHAFLPHRFLVLKAIVQGGGTSLPIVLNVNGPWDNVVISPDPTRKAGDAGPGSAAAVQ